MKSIIQIPKSIINVAVAMGCVTVDLPDFSKIIKKESLWEYRQHQWQTKWGNGDDYSELYRKLIDLTIGMGYGDLSNVQPWFVTDEIGTSMPLKRIAEILIGRKLPDINPVLCIKWAKETPFSAENIYNGLTG